VVGEAGERHLRARGVRQPAREVLALGEQDREVVQAGLARRRPRARQLAQAQELGPGGAEPRLAAALLEDVEADRAAVELERAVEVGDRQGDGACVGAVR
jgi:hypothetical protein